MTVTYQASLGFHIIILSERLVKQTKEIIVALYLEFPKALS